MADDRPTSPAAPAGFYRPCWVEVDSAALRSNIQKLRQRLKPETALLAVVKADGYGHGLLATTRAALASGAVMLGVSSLEEGETLRRSGITAPILILGGLFPFEHFSVLFERQLTPTLASLAAAQSLQRLAAERKTRVRVHLKVDSGFGRIGVSTAAALEFIQAVAAMAELEIEGLYTHFASSDVDPGYTQQQATAFLAVVDAAQKLGISPRFIHLANSAAVLQYPQWQGSMVRPGLALYGIAPYAGAEATIALAPALTWKTRVIFLKTVPAGSSISYARTWTARRPTRVATLAVGYADGLPRVLTNKGHVLIGGKRAPILGRVTMDMTMVDVTESPECRVGDEAVLIGRQGSAQLTALQLAEWADTNAYEILCGISTRVPRVLKEPIHGQ